jgi:hypothetical protein
MAQAPHHNQQYRCQATGLAMDARRVCKAPWEKQKAGRAGSEPSQIIDIFMALRLARL